MKKLEEYIKEGLLDDGDSIVKNVDRSIKREIKQFLKDTYIGASRCKISREPDEDGKYIVNSIGSLIIAKPEIDSLTNGFFKFGEVDKDFDCSSCKNLVSLEGAPERVGGSFYCNYCFNLTSLEGGPKEVDGDFYCQFCENLTSLEGGPKEVGKDFSCRFSNSLTSLEGAPKRVGRNFDCSACPELTSLKHCPQESNGNFLCSYNDKLTSLKYIPKVIKGDLFIIDCGKKFTEEEVAAVCQVKKHIYGLKIYGLKK